MSTFLIFGAHGAIIYVMVFVSYLAYKEMTRDRALTFLELFIYMEKHFDKVQEELKKEAQGTNNKNFEYSQRIIDRIKKLMEDDKREHKKD